MLDKNNIAKQYSGREREPLDFQRRQPPSRYRQAAVCASSISTTPSEQRVSTGAAGTTKAQVIDHMSAPHRIRRHGAQPRQDQHPGCLPGTDVKINTLD
jgi:hypothetical protein